MCSRGFADDASHAESPRDTSPAFETYRLEKMRRSEQKTGGSEVTVNQDHLKTLKGAGSVLSCLELTLFR